MTTPIPGLTDLSVRKARPVRIVIVLAALLVLAMMVTWVFRAMRTVMAVGGACAKGGPYVAAQPCPDGAWTIGVAVPVLILVLLVGTAIAVSERLPDLLLPMWGGLFGALGWNFLEFGLDGSGNAGYLVCAVVFWLMALPAVLVLLTGYGSFVIRKRTAAAGYGGPGRIYAWLLCYCVVATLGAWLGWESWARVV